MTVFYWTGVRPATRTALRDSGSPAAGPALWPLADSLGQRGVRRRRGLHGLLEETVKQLAPAGFAVAARRAAEAFGPAKLSKVCPVRRGGRETHLELQQIARVVLQGRHGPASYWWCQPEASKYPFDPVVPPDKTGWRLSEIVEECVLVLGSVWLRMR